MTDARSTLSQLVGTAGAAAQVGTAGAATLVGTAGAAGLATRALLEVAPALPAAVRAPLDRVNHRGERVSLAEGPAAALGVTLAAASGVLAVGGGARIAGAVVLAGGACGAVGLYDDIVGARPEQRQDKGFRGHLRALRAGRVSTGAAKVAGIGAAGLACAALIRRPGGATMGRVVDLMLDAGLVAGSANLLNLFDLRPGRALKVALLTGVPLGLATRCGQPGGAADRAGAAAIVAAACGGAAGALPHDLGERTMLGDTGANALGAVLGLAAAAGLPRPARAVTLAGIVALTAASEKVSFTRVIARTPVLRELDGLGRRPVHVPGAAGP